MFLFEIRNVRNRFCLNFAHIFISIIMQFSRLFRTVPNQVQGPLSKNILLVFLFEITNLTSLFCSHLVHAFIVNDKAIIMYFQSCTLSGAGSKDKNLFYAFIQITYLTNRFCINFEHQFSVITMYFEEFQSRVPYQAAKFSFTCFLVIILTFRSTLHQWRDPWQKYSVFVFN